MMEYVNEARSAECATRNAVEPLLVMLAPYAPHLCEELWAALGRPDSIFGSGRWPAYDEHLAAEEEVELVVQVNGKLRARLTVPRGVTQADAVARAQREEAVRRFVDGKDVRKVVYVPDRLVNLVV